MPQIQQHITVQTVKTNIYDVLILPIIQHFKQPMHNVNLRNGTDGCQDECVYFCLCHKLILTRLIVIIIFNIMKYN